MRSKTSQMAQSGPKMAPNEPMMAQERCFNGFGVDFGSLWGLILAPFYNLLLIL